MNDETINPQGVERSGGRAVFLSYASQDADPARRICEALRAGGVEVWFDQSELRGGDAWDQKIRRQIKECALFIPVVSAHTQARTEGYFRLEWRLADQRTHLMARGRPFLLPVVIDDTRDADAHVPDSFMEVQWTGLSGGETPVAFCERVKRLMGGEVARPFRPVSTGDGTYSTGSKARATRGRRWHMPALIGAAIIVALLIARPWQRPMSPVSSTPSIADTKSPAPLSEARQLTLKARALIDDDLMAVRESFRLAEELCERAVKLAPDDSEAWATLARISAEVIDANYDTTAQRRESARIQAERAVRLSHDSIDAGLAMATYLYATDDVATAETRLRELADRAPLDARVALLLSRVLDRLNRGDEASDLRRNHPALGVGDPRAMVVEAGSLMNRRRYFEAEEMVDRAQAIAPSRRGYIVKFILMGLVRADLPNARAYAEKLPPVVLREDHAIGLVARMYLGLGEPNHALELLNRVPRDFIEESREVFPKGYLTGHAMQLSGRQAAAESEWRAALAVVEKRLATDPNRAVLLRWKSLLLALTGQAQEADRNWKLFLELIPPGDLLGSRRLPPHMLNLYQAEFLHAQGRTEQAIEAILGDRRWIEAPVPGVLSMLQFDPWLAPLRKDPRVQAIIADGEAWRKSLQRGQAPSSEPSRLPAEAKSVAVLAFKNLSDDQASDYFSDGISEELANVLGRVPGLRVAGSTSAFSFKGKAVPVPEIARQLGVTHVVEGTVRRSGNRVIISAKLLNAGDGFQLWVSENLDREVKDSLAVQDEIAGLIAKSLSLKLGVSTPAATATVNPEAFRLYLEGREAWRQRGRQGVGNVSAGDIEALFQKAIVVDPAFARAHASLSMAWAGRYYLAGGDKAAPDLGARARRAIEAALALDPNLAEVYLARARMLAIDGQSDEAKAAFHRAIALNPSDATAHLWYGETLFNRGKLTEGLAEAEIATRLDPLSPIVITKYMRDLRDGRRWREALTAADRTLALQPDHGEALGVRVDALAGLGRIRDARLEYQAIGDGAASVVASSRPDHIVRLAAIGDLAGAAKMAETLLKDPQNVAPERMLRVYAALARADEGFAYLDRRGLRPFDQRNLPRGLHPVYDRIRDDPRFVRKLEEAGILSDYREAWSQYLAWKKQTGEP